MTGVWRGPSGSWWPDTWCWPQGSGGAAWLAERQNDARAAENRELVCDVARLNGALVAYYERIVTEPVAAGVTAEIELLLIEARAIAPHLNDACAGQPIPPPGGGT